MFSIVLLVFLYALSLMCYADCSYCTNETNSSLNETREYMSVTCLKSCLNSCLDDNNNCTDKCIDSCKAKGANDIDMLSLTTGTQLAKSYASHRPYLGELNNSGCSATSTDGLHACSMDCPTGQTCKCNSYATDCTCSCG
jgi:hypothetical protein